MLNKLLKEKNISVYRLAKCADIPYTTLNELVLGKKNLFDCSLKTVSKLARALDMTTDTLVARLTRNDVVLATNWQKNKYKKYIFPIIYPSNYYDASSIHPLMQSLVRQVVERIKDEKEVKQLILFGSSTNIRCNKNSDLDFAVLLKDEYDNIESKNKISELIGEITNYNNDIIWLNNLDQTTNLYKNIERGLIIYE